MVDTRYTSHLNAFPPVQLPPPLTGMEMETGEQRQPQAHRAPYPVQDVLDELPPALSNVHLTESEQLRDSRDPRDPLAGYSPQGRRFHESYAQAVADAPQFTPQVQLHWCKTLLELSQDAEFIREYTINGEKLPQRIADSKTASRNQKIMLEHALKVLSKLIKLRHAPAFYLMGGLYSHKVEGLSRFQFIERDDARALSCYERGARLGHGPSCYRAGLSFEFGRGTPVDTDAAARFYRMGAGASDVDCMYRLASLFVEKQISEGIEWYLRAAAQGSPHACFELGKIYEFSALTPALQQRLQQAFPGESFPQTTRALQYYYKCAHEHGYSLAQWKLGHCYEFGELGLPVHAKKSLAWYYASVSGGKSAGTTANAMGMLGLAGWYFTGVPGVLQPNWQEACKWVSQCAAHTEGKLARADYILGQFYDSGVGCPRDHHTAQIHYKRALAHGFHRAAAHIDNTEGAGA